MTLSLANIRAELSAICHHDRMSGLFYSIGALFIGPLLLRLAGERRGVLQFVDGLVLASIGSLVLAFFLPHAVESGGWGAVAAFIVGIALPTALERVQGIVNERVHDATLFVGMLALALHALTDGMALTEQAQSDQPALAAAVVLHQLPVGLAVWWLVRTTHGKRAAILVLLGISAATAAGYGLGDRLAIIDSTVFLWLLAFVAGSLIHVLLHSKIEHIGHAHSHDAPASRFYETLGAAVGIGGIAFAAANAEALADHAGDLHGFGQRFLHYAFESAPALLLGYILAGLLVYFVPAASVQWLRGRSRVGQAARGMVYGLPLPVCSCGVVPLYSSLIRAGAPVAAGLAFLVATPELGVGALMLSFPLLGTELALVRLFAAALLAFSVGVLVSRFARPVETIVQSGQADAAAMAPKNVIQRVGMAIRHGLVDVLDDTAAWIVAGLTIAALLTPEALQPLAVDLPSGMDVLICALLGIPMYVCASGATPLAAALIAGGISPGAAITFLLSGPATNVTTFGLLGKLHGQKAAIAFGVVVVAVATGLGLLTNVWFGSLTAAAPDLHGSHHGLLAHVSLAILALAFVLAIFRQGPRQFLGTLFDFGGGTHAIVDDGAESAKTPGSCCHGDAAAHTH